MSTSSSTPQLDIHKLTQLRRLPAGSSPDASPNDELFETLAPSLERMGNPLAIAYGGSTLAISMAAAFLSLLPNQKDFSIYSMLGTYLGPADAKKPVRLISKHIRDTRSFATRLVLATQQQPNGTWRAMFSTLCDFTVPRPRESAQTLLSYSASPRQKFDDPNTLPSFKDVLQRGLAQGAFSKGDLEYIHANMSPMARYMDIRALKESLWFQHGFGMRIKEPTSQDDLHITDRFTVEWARSTIDLKEASQRTHEGESLSFKGLNACLAAFYTDGILSFLPLAHSGGKQYPPLWFQDAAACATLDIALRWHSDDVDLTQWHLRELKTLTGGHERHFTESKIYDSQGRLALTMSQQCALRGQPPQKAKVAKDQSKL